MKNCPVGHKTCPCPEYSKQGKCDYPYRKEMTYKDILKLSAKLKVGTIRE